MQPLLSDSYVSAPLTNVSIAYLPELEREFVHQRVFADVPVQMKSGPYFEFPKGQWHRTDAKPTGPGMESPGSGFDLTTKSYSTEVYKLHQFVDEQVLAAQQSPLNLDAAAAEFVTRGLMLQKEVKWAATHFTTSIWTGSTTGGDIVPGALWDTGLSTPIADIRAQMSAMKSKTGFMPNKLILPEQVWAALQDNPDFLNRISISRDKIVTAELLAAVLGLNRMPGGEVLIAGGIQNSAAEGAADSLDYILGKDALLVYAAPRPGLMTPSAGYNFSWRGFLGGQASGLRMLRIEEKDPFGVKIVGETAYEFKRTGDDLGVFFNGVIS